MITAYITCDWEPVDEYKLKMQQSKTTHYLSISADEFWLINHWLWRRLARHETMKSLTFRDQYYPHARVRSGNMDLEGAKSKSIKSLIYSWSTPLEDFNEQLQLKLGQACHSCSFSRDISFFFRTPSAVILFMAACSKAFDGCERCRPWPRAAQLCS